MEGIKILIPMQTFEELEGLEAELALKLVYKNEYEEIEIPGNDADAAIINYAKKNPEVIVATLDRGLQRKLKNKKLIIRGKKKLEIV